MAIITLQDWYQLDYQLPNSEKRATVLKIADVMSRLRAEGLVDMWFFLYEGKTIRVRMKSGDKNVLKERLKILVASEELEESEKLPFSEYQEGSEMLFNETFVEFFAKVMSLATELTVSKLREEIEFDTYTALERVHHCMFNNMAGLSLKPEEYFLVQRLQERTRKPFDRDFENKI